MDNINYVCFAIIGSEEEIKDEVENLQLMLGEKYSVQSKTGRSGTKLLSVAKIEKHSFKEH